MITLGNDFCGIGSIEQALIRLGIAYKTIYSCDIDKYVKQTFFENYDIKEEEWFTDVYERPIPKEPVTIYMTSPPCQSFSIAGQRKGEGDDRGVLFYNSLEFIKQNKPKMFIFENVRGLMSVDGGKVFSRWVELLGGKSVNGMPIMFPVEGSVPYNLYYTVLNARNYGVPQNRERVFLVGFREDYAYRFPSPISLSLKLSDLLDKDVDEKYFLSSKFADTLIKHKKRNKEVGFKELTFETEVSPTITTKYDTRGTDGYLITHNLQKRSADRPSIKKNKSAGGSGHLQKEDQTSCCVDPGNNQAIEFVADYRTDEGLRIRKDGNSPCLTASHHSSTEPSRMAPLIGIKSNMRRLTPRECMRLMGFPDSFKLVCSDTQCYKMAGNSIVVDVIYHILKNIDFKKL